MALIYKTSNYTVESKDIPYVDRLEGGHIRILSRFEIDDYLSINIDNINELTILTFIVGKAMIQGLKNSGIEIGKVEYMNIGPWGNLLCVHIFGRAKNATLQKWGHNLFLPQMKSRFYDNFIPLNEQDIANIKEEIIKLLSQYKFDKVI